MATDRPTLHETAGASVRSCRALVTDRDLVSRVAVVEVPPPGPGEVRVRVRWAGVCGSDLHVLTTGDWVDDWPAVLGHEVYGDVDAVGPGVDGLAVGDPVVLDSRLPCLRCRECDVDPNRCTDLRFLGEARPGGFAEYVTVPEPMVHDVPAALDGSVAVLAEPLAVAMHALSHVRGTPGRIAILGHGPIGTLVHIEILRRYPHAPVDVAEPAPIRAAVAEGLRATVVDRSSDLEEGAYDLVVDCAGHRSSLEDAVRATRAGGTVLIVALSHRPASIVPMRLAEKRLTIVGTNAFVDELPEAITVLAEEPRRYRAVVTHTVGLDELPERLTALRDAPDAVKLLVRP